MAFAPGILTALMTLAARRLTAIVTLVANRQAAKSLATLDERALKDIGLTPLDVGYALSLPYDQDPTLHLALVAAGRGSVSGGTRPPALHAAHKDRLGDLPSAEPALCV